MKVIKEAETSKFMYFTIEGKEYDIRYNKEKAFLDCNCENGSLYGILWGILICVILGFVFFLGTEKGYDQGYRDQK